MAACGGQQPACTTMEGSPEDYEAKLDVSSEHFEPLLALYSPHVTLPYPDIRCFNNLAQYESFLKGRAKPHKAEKKKTTKGGRGRPDPERIERLRQLMVKDPQGEEDGNEGPRRPPRKQKIAKNVLTRMALHAGSPLGELYRCVQERIRVRVHIRTFKGLRGVCSGFVVAFDKFWNLAMVDVDETYRKPLLGEAFHHERALTVTRLFDRLKLQEKTETRSTGQPKGEQASDCGSPSGSKPIPPETKLESDRPAVPSTRQTERTDVGCDTGIGTSMRRTRQGKADYHTVHTRHINQLFIRGENVLLINLHQ